MAKKKPTKKPTARAAARTAAQKKSPARKAAARKAAAKSTARKKLTSKGRAAPPAKRARPKQRIAISHYRDEDFKADGLRTYAHYRISWYDALIVAAAVQADCAVLYSEDFQDGQDFGQTRVKNPFA